MPRAKSRFDPRSRTTGPRVPALLLAVCLAPALLSAPMAPPGPPPGRGPLEDGDEAPTRRRPNIVFIFTDDQDDDQFSFFGDAALTPHIDSLARDGAYFSRFYVSAAVCTPSRFNCLTGQYASRSRAVLDEFPPPGPSCLTWNANLQPGEKTFAHALREAGYVTGIVGKWMCGYPPDLIEVTHEDDFADPKIKAALRSNYEKTCAWIREHFGFDYAESIYKSNLPGVGLPRILWEHNMEWITQGALEFIETNAERPFCLYLATTLPHTPINSIHQDPLIVPTGLLDEAPDVQPSREDVLERVERAGLPVDRAVYTWLDDAVGAVLAKLDELELAQDTIVFFAPDHATRGKYTCYEGANVPLFVRWPGQVAAGARPDELVSNIDLLPTFLEIAGAEPLPGMHLDGESFLPLLEGREVPWRDSLLLEIAYTKAVVTQEWKYIALRFPEEVQALVELGERRDFAQDGGSRFRRAPRSFPGYFDDDQLYNLTDDPLEQHNLAADPEQAERLKRLRGLLAQHLHDFPSSFGEFHEARD